MKIFADENILLMTINELHQKVFRKRLARPDGCYAGCCSKQMEVSQRVTVVSASESNL
jgi:hypothetical protein